MRFGVLGLGLGVLGFGFWVWGLGFGVEGRGLVAFFAASMEIGRFPALGKGGIHCDMDVVGVWRDTGELKACVGEARHALDLFVVSDRRGEGALCFDLLGMDGRSVLCREF